MISKNRLLNWSSLLLVNLLWAGQFPAYKVASEHMSAPVLNFWTFACATVLVFPFLIVTRRRRPASADPKMNKKTFGEFLLLGVVGIVPPSVFLAWGIAHSTASSAAIISLVIPVLMALMAVIMLGEHMTWVRGVSFGVAILGTLLVSKMSWEGNFFSGPLLIGNAVIFLSWMGAAFYNTYSKKLLARFSELEVLVYGYVVACGSCLLLSLLGSGLAFSDLKAYPLAAWGGVLVLGGLSWGLAMLPWMWVLKRLDVTQISVSVYLLPLFGVILSALTLHERPTVTQLTGGALVLGATLLISDYESRRLQKREAAKRIGV